MKKYSVRPATIRDIEAVYALIAAQNLNDFGDANITLDGLHRRWQKTLFEKQTCMAYADGELEGYAELRDGDSPFIYLVDKNNIDLGFQLLMVLEDFAKDNKVVELSTQISARNQTLLELFLLNGYHSNLSFLIMELMMTEPPAAPEWAEGIQVRSFIRGQDEQATFRADEEAAEDKGYHEPLDFDGWSKRMGLGSERFDSGLWFLACDGNEIAGVALNYHDRRSDSGWVDHLGVRRDWRKKGIGKALLLHTFGEFYRRGVKHIKLSVDSKSLTNAPHLYESVGMKTIHEYHIYRKELPVQ
jgi:GNAT superfamily N-acetyltransferase